MDKLIERIIKTNNPTVAGLDPTPAYIPDFIKQKALSLCGDKLEAAARSLYFFNMGLIDALCDIVPAVKPQSAFYEAFGWQGVKALKDTIDYAHSKGLYVILDGKRNDIGSTMSAYATAYLGRVTVDGQEIEPFGADGLTVNGYLGKDGIDPLLAEMKKYDRDIFVLAKTSNPSSGDLQDRMIGGDTVYEVLGELCRDWGKELIGKRGYSNVGTVVGATYPEQLVSMRKRFPQQFFLVPGYGAQGGSAADIKGAFDQGGMGAIVNSSRGIMCAWQKEKCNEADFADAARREAIRMRDELNAVRC